MKTIITFLLTTFCFVAYASSDTLKVKTSAQCGECKRRIENKLNFSKGVKRAVLDLETKEVTVIFDQEKTNPDNIREAISKTGYDADHTLADEKAYNKLPKCCQKGGMDHH